MYRVLDGIETLLRRAKAEDMLNRLVVERDVLADVLGVGLTDVERETLRAIPHDTLVQMLRSLDGPTGPLAQPRPLALFGRDRVTRGIRSRD